MVKRVVVLTLLFQKIDFQYHWAVAAAAKNVLKAVGLYLNYRITLRIIKNKERS
jgi:hypothetical protein